MQNYSFDFIGIGFYCNYIICNIKTISGILDVETRYFLVSLLLKRQIKLKVNESFLTIDF